MGNHYLDPLTRKSTQCNICNSIYMAEIESRYFKDHKPRALVKWLSEQDPPFSTTIQSVINHCKKHTLKLLENNQEKIISFDDNKTNSKNENDLTDEQIKSLTGFLDLVIDKVHNAVKSGNLKPSVAEGVKAAEIKAKIKEDSKFEKDLVKYFTSVSSRAGITN